MFTIAFALALAAPISLPPVDRCRGDAQFSRVRAQLQKVVDKRDLDGLLSLMSDDVRVSFGGAFGRERFSDYWTASEQDRELLWSELGSALRLGCAQATDGEGKPYKVIPGMFVTGDDLDGFSTWVSLPGAILRSEPNVQSPAKMRLPAWTVLVGGPNPEHVATPAPLRLFIAFVVIFGVVVSVLGTWSRRAVRTPR